MHLTTKISAKSPIWKIPAKWKADWDQGLNHPLMTESYKIPSLKNTINRLSITPFFIISKQEKTSSILSISKHSLKGLLYSWATLKYLLSMPLSSHKKQAPSSFLAEISNSQKIQPNQPKSLNFHSYPISLKKTLRKSGLEVLTLCAKIL